METIDSKKVIIKLIRFIQHAFKRSGFSKALVGVSGGVDSAVSLALTVRALGAEHAYPVFMPYGTLNEKGTKEALEFVTSLHIPSNNVHTVNIQPFVDPIVLQDPNMDNVRRGNIIARIRMIVLYDLTKKLKALVVGTENRTEYLLGYYTRYGDDASDLEPLKHLYKTQVYQLAECLGVPQTILSKPPTAGLWPGQTDEKELGFSYTLVDEVLTLKKEMINKKFEPAIIRRIQAWIMNGKIKSQLPYCAKRARVLSSGSNY